MSAICSLGNDNFSNKHLFLGDSVPSQVGIYVFLRSTTKVVGMGAICVSTLALLI